MEEKRNSLMGGWKGGRALDGAPDSPQQSLTDSPRLSVSFSLSLGGRQGTSCPQHHPVGFSVPPPTVLEKVRSLTLPALTAFQLPSSENSPVNRTCSSF